MIKNNFILTFLALIILSGCATLQEKYKNDDDKLVELPNKAIKNTFYLIGDAGNSPLGEMSLGLQAFKKQIENKDTKDDYVLFLGDNIYPSGFDQSSKGKEAHAENAINAQAKAIEDFKGTKLFIPGNHDWYAGGVEGLKKEEKYVEKVVGKDTFQPENGCPLESIDVSDEVQLIVIDTQWYLENWNRNPTINDECEIKTRDRFFQELAGELKKAQNKRVIFAMHHPMYTNGSHGGYYGASKHLFPTQSNFPLPILSSLITQVRTQGGVSIQDRFNERYNELMNRIETIALEYNNIVFASGHEHNLQYIENKGIKQVVSGSGSKSSAVALGNNGLFAYGKEGFAKLTVYKDGSVWVSFYKEQNGNPIALFNKEVLPKSRDVFDIETLPDTFPQTVKASVYTSDETNKSGIHKMLLGERYRKLYSTKIEFPVATLDTLYGGLNIVRAGGGNQTRSLRLETKDGRQLNMRALRKSATQYLQNVLFKENYIANEFEKTEVENLVLDFYTAAHPYAFLAVPDLSDAAKIYHTNPKVFFIPKHKYMGDYNTNYGGELYMIEERPEKNYSHERNFGYADDIESTHDIIEKVREDEKYKIDENAFIRARLFDMLIGDWDRHQDQWRWAQFDQENGDKLFKPIPRDRDQVFSNFDGALLDIVRFLSGASRQLQVYDSELKDIKWMNSAGIKLDKVLIQQSGKDVWIKQAKFLQENVTDEVIEKAFTHIPEEARDSSLLDVQKHLKGRRENLVDIAERYADYLNELVIISGTDKDDYFEITRTGNKETNVKVSRIIGGEKGEVLVDRIFNKDTTKELWIYGLDDDDVFEVTGKANNLIFTRIIGGQNNDVYKIKNGRRVRVYDHKSKPNTIEENKGARIHFTDIYNNNLFDFKKNIVRSNVITPNVGYNPDDGVLIGLSNIYTVKGFQRNPFSQQHRFYGGYFFATNGFSLDYEGEFANVFGEWNFHVGGTLTTENFTNNFFGYGNETENSDDEKDLDYNRVKKSIYKASVGVLRRGNFGSDYGIHLIAEGIEIGNSADRFIDEIMPKDSNSEFYNRRYFVGVEGNYNYASFDNKITPTRGMTFNVNSGVKTEPKDTKFTYGYLNTDLGFFNSLSKNRKLVLKTDVRSQLRFGDDLVFYQASNIGGKNGLRGYRTERFTGKNSLVGSADVRYSFKSFRTKTLPMQLGVFVGGDVGRVWLKNDFSDKWHNDYGGGFWVSAADSIQGTFNFFNSEEGLRFSFGFGVAF